MSFDIVLDHITTIKKDTEYIHTILNDHLPKQDGRQWVCIPSFQLDQNERNEITEITESIVTRVSEINQELSHDGWKQYTQQPTQHSAVLYSTAIGLNQEQYPDDALLFEPLGKMIQSLNGLEQVVKVTIAENKANSSQKKYSESQVNASIQELEKEKRVTRLKVYNKLDPDLKKLSADIATLHNDVLDRTVDKILRLSGFDTEIYDPGIPGNIDVIATESREEIVCIFENTVGKLSKTKVDQIVGRKTEYGEEYKSWKSVKVYPVLVCINDTVFTDNLAKRECVLNAVSVLTKKELEDLIKNIRKSKMSPSLFIEYVKKKIPKD